MACITALILHSRNPFSQWQRSVHWKPPSHWLKIFPDHGAIMGHIWVLSAPYGHHVCPMSLAIRVAAVSYRSSKMGPWLLLAESTPDITCKTTPAGNTHKGFANVTVSGLPCQRWDSQSPHSHSYSDPWSFPDATMIEVSNYCRNPDLEDDLWCFTTTSVRWESCAVPMCNSK